MNTQQHTRHPFEASRPNYKALWDDNFAWDIVAFAMLLFALAIWAFFALGWYQPQINAPVDVPAVEGPAGPVPQTDRAATPVAPSA